MSKTRPSEFFAHVVLPSEQDRNDMGSTTFWKSMKSTAYTPLSKNEPYSIQRVKILAFSTARSHREENFDFYR